MLDKIIIKVLSKKGYRIAQNGERSRYLLRILSVDGQEAHNTEIAKCKEIKKELGIDLGVEIVPDNFI